MRGLQEELDLPESRAIGEEANVRHHDVCSTQLVEPVHHTQQLQFCYTVTGWKRYIVVHVSTYKFKHYVYMHVREKYVKKVWQPLSYIIRCILGIATTILL